jgi:hypothetical protein
MLGAALLLAEEGIDDVPAGKAANTMLADRPRASIRNNTTIPISRLFDPGFLRMTVPSFLPFALAAIKPAFYAW